MPVMELTQEEILDEHKREEAERAYFDVQADKKREHELAVLKLKGENDLKKLEAKAKLNNKLKKVVVHCIVILKLFKREVPDSFTKLIND